MKKPTEEELKVIYDIIAGNGMWKALGPNLNTYPKRDQSNKRLHSICVELERRGLIKRHEITPTNIFWIKKKKE